MVNIEIKENVAIVRPARPIADSKDALDVIHTVRFQTGRNNMLLERSAFVPEMFDLSTGVVTQVLKAFVDEKMRLAIVGDLYDCYQSSMRDIIFTCNRSNQVSFWETEAEGLAWLNKKQDSRKRLSSKGRNLTLRGKCFTRYVAFLTMEMR